MASHDPSSARNRRRRRPAWSTVALAALAPAAAARAAHPSSLRKNARRHAPKITKGKGRGEATHAMVDAAHRPVVPMGSSHGNNNLSGGNEKLLADAAVAAEGAAILYGAAQNNAGGSSNRGSMVVVQPENLGGSEAVAVDPQSQQSQARGDVQLHAWPHPDTFQADEQRQPQAGTEYYYKNGQVVLEVQGAPAQPSSDAATSGKRVDTAYHVAAYNYGRAQPPAEVPGGASSKALPSPQEDLDAVAGKQVLLRPRLSHEANEAEAPTKGAALPPMGSSKERTGGGAGEGEEPAVYYYDPQALQSAAAASANTKTGDAEAAPELTLPAVVYDASGRAVTLEEVHAGGRNEVFLEVQPRAVWGADGLASAPAAGAVPSRRGFASASTSAGSSASSAGGRGQDQWIVLATVATMSLLVGALSAKRLRSRRLLEGCLHPELDDECDDDLGGSAIIGSATPRYDKKFDADGASGEGVGFGALLGGRRGGHYGTTGDGLGSGLHWRGDAEKFDV